MLDLNETDEMRARIEHNRREARKLAKNIESAQGDWQSEMGSIQALAHGDPARLVGAMLACRENAEVLQQILKIGLSEVTSHLLDELESRQRQAECN